jgi:hypothetical protein
LDAGLHREGARWPNAVDADKALSQVGKANKKKLLAARAKAAIEKSKAVTQAKDGRLPLSSYPRQQPSPVWSPMSSNSCARSSRRAFGPKQSRKDLSRCRLSTILIVARGMPSTEFVRRLVSEQMNLHT